MGLFGRKDKEREEQEAAAKKAEMEREAKEAAKQMQENLEKRKAEAEAKKKKEEAEERARKASQRRQMAESQKAALERKKAAAILDTYTVVSGDTLSEIALKFYKSAARDKWMAIYEANKDVIGDDYNVIKPGQELKIPKLD